MVSKDLTIEHLKVLFDNGALKKDDFKKDLENYTKSEFIEYLISTSESNDEDVDEY